MIGSHALKIIATRTQGGGIIKRNPSKIEEIINDRGITYPADRKDIIRFAKGKQVESDVMDLLMGIPEIEYNTPDDIAREVDFLEKQRARGDYIRPEY